MDADGRTRCGDACACVARAGWEAVEREAKLPVYVHVRVCVRTRALDQSPNRSVARWTGGADGLCIVLDERNNPPRAPGPILSPRWDRDGTACASLGCGPCLLDAWFVAFQSLGGSCMPPLTYAWAPHRRMPRPASCCPGGWKQGKGRLAAHARAALAAHVGACRFGAGPACVCMRACVRACVRACAGCVHLWGTCVHEPGHGASA